MEIKKFSKNVTINVDLSEDDLKLLIHILAKTNNETDVNAGVPDSTGFNMYNEFIHCAIDNKISYRVG